eukprot:scaffold6979_cov56-Attheya_sp.AAC.5
MIDYGSGDEIYKEEDLVNANESPSSSKDSDDKWYPPALSSPERDCFDPIGTGTTTATPRIVSQDSSTSNILYPHLQETAPERAAMPLEIKSAPYGSAVVATATEPENATAIESCNIKEEEMKGARSNMSEPMVFQMGENVWVKSGKKGVEYEAQVMSTHYKYDGEIAYMQIKWAVRGTTDDVKVSDVSLLFQADDLEAGTTKRSSRRKPKQTKRFEPKVETKVKRAPNKKMKQVRKRKNTVKTKAKQSRKGLLQSEKTKSETGTGKDANIIASIIMSQQLTSDIRQNESVPHREMSSFQESPTTDAVQDEASERYTREGIGIKDEGVEEVVTGMTKEELFQKGDHVHVKNGNRGIEYHAMVISDEFTYFPQDDKGDQRNEPYIEIQWDVQGSKAFVKVSDTSLILDVDDLNAESVVSGNVRRSRRIPKQTNRFKPITDAPKKIKKCVSTQESHPKKVKKDKKEKLVEHTYINILWKPPPPEIQEAHVESDEESLATVKMPDIYLMQSDSVYQEGLCDDASLDLNEYMTDNAPKSKSPGGGTIDSFFHSTQRKSGTFSSPAKRRPIVQSQTPRRSKKRNPMANSPGLENYFSSEKQKSSKRSIWNDSPSDTQHTPELPPTNQQRSIEEHSAEESSSDDSSTIMQWDKMKKARSANKSRRFSDYYSSSPKKAQSLSSDPLSARTNVHESQKVEDCATADSLAPTAAFSAESHTTAPPASNTISGGKETIHETNATHSHGPNSVSSLHENENGREGDTTDQLSAPQKQTDHLSVDTANIVSNVMTRLDDSGSNGIATQTSESRRQTADYSSNVCVLLNDSLSDTQHTPELPPTNQQRSIEHSAEESSSSSDDSSTILQWDQMKKAWSTNKSRARRFSDYYLSSPKKAQEVEDCTTDSLHETENGEGNTTDPLSAPQKQTDDVSVDTAHVLSDVVTGLDDDSNGTTTHTSKSRRQTADSSNVRDLLLDLDPDLLPETTHEQHGEPNTAVLEAEQDPSQVETKDDSSCGTVELLSSDDSNGPSNVAAEDGESRPFEIDLTQMDDDNDDSHASESPPPRRRKRGTFESFRSHVPRVILNFEEQDVICLLDDDSD